MEVSTVLASHKLTFGIILKARAGSSPVLPTIKTIKGEDLKMKN